MLNVEKQLVMNYIIMVFTIIIPNYGTDIGKVKRVMVPSPADYVLKS